MRLQLRDLLFFLIHLLIKCLPKIIILTALHTNETEFRSQFLHQKSVSSTRLRSRIKITTSEPYYSKLIESSQSVRRHDESKHSRMKNERVPFTSEITHTRVKKSMFLFFFRDYMVYSSTQLHRVQRSKNILAAFSRYS